MRRAFFAALAALPIAVPTTVEAQAIEGVAAIVAQLRSAGRIDRASVESLAGQPLRRAEAGNPYFASWRGGRVAFGPITISDIDFREPIPGSAATAGPFLALTIGAGCARRQEVERRFGPLSQIGVPRGRSLDEQTRLARQETFGQLSFGFAERNPDCLSSIAVTVPRP